MKELIPRIIFNLLAKRHTVILPQLGTLYTEYVPPRMDAASGKLRVPYYLLRFTEDLAEGETLPEILARLSGREEKDVRRMYNNWISEIRKFPSETIIPHVCTIRPSQSGHYEVEASGELSRWLNPMGSDFIDLPLPAVTGTPGLKPESHAPRKKSKGILAVIGISACIGVLAAGYYFYKYTPAKPDADPPVRESAVTGTQPEVAADTASAVRPDTAFRDTVPSAVVRDTIPVSKEVYHLVGGVFSTRENAERYISQKGFTGAEIITMANGRFMVSVARFADKKEADREMRNLHRRYPEIWVSKRSR